MAARNLTLLEARVNQIVHLRLEGGSDTYVAGQLCVPISTISAIEESLKYVIHVVIKKGADSIEEVANILEMNQAVLVSFMSLYGSSILNLKKKKSPYMEEDALIVRAREAGARSIDEFVQLTGLSEKKVIQYVNGKNGGNQESVLLLEKPVENEDGNIDRLVIPSIDKLKKFELLLQKINNVYGDDIWSFGKALEHESLTKNSINRTPFETVLAIFEVYHEAEKRGERLPLSYFASRFGISQTSIDCIFKRVNIKPMFRTISRPPQEQREAVLKVWESSLPASDIAYFANEYFETKFSISTYNNILREKGTSRKINKPKVSKSMMITYKLASLIYYTVDYYKILYGGFTLPQIEKEVGVTRAQIKAALKMRDTLEPRIVGALRIFTGTEIDTPYLDLLRYKKAA